jgi:hypothetical protein
MNDQIETQARSSTSHDSTADKVKAVYSKPILRVYGSVTALTMSASGTVGDGKGMNMAASDRRTKENIVRIGVHPLGIGLYLFDYRPQYRDTYGHGRMLGVMADEVETVRPAAVHVHDDGYLIVDYGMLH